MSQGSFSSSPAVQAPISGSDIEAAMAGLLSGAQTGDSEGDLPGGFSLARLPPLPPGLALEHLAQYGSVGLEMAIRMGMGIGMGLGQSARQQSETPQPPSRPSLQPVDSFASSLASDHSSHRSAPKSADIVTDILNDDFFSSRAPSTPAAGAATPGLGHTSHLPNTSRPPSGHPSPRSPVMASPLVMAATPSVTGPPDEHAKNDPLATQVWKAYAKAREGLPNGPRMENLTWRLMHMTLKKVDAPSEGMQAVKEEDEHQLDPIEATEASDVVEEPRGRGRTNKGKSRVVGFNADSPEAKDE